MNDSDFERLLNGVLREDAQVEPLTGLEERVMARVRIEPQRRPSWWMVSLGAASVGLAMYFVMVSFGPHRSTSPPQLETAIHEGVTAPALGPATDNRKPEQRPRTGSPEVLAVMSARREIAETTAEETRELPKLDVFPTPSPVPKPMQELAAVSRQSGAAAELAETSSEPEPPVELKIEPLTIARIEIAPLHPPTDAKEDEADQ